MTRKRGVLVIAAMAAALVGCASDKSFLFVTVTTTSGQVENAVQLTVTVRSKNGTDDLAFPEKAGPPFTIAQDRATTLTIGVAPRHAGAITVGVTPVNASGASLGYGEQVGFVDPGNTTSVAVAVTPGARPPERPDAGVDTRTGGKLDANACNPAAPATCGAARGCFVGCRGTVAATTCGAAGQKGPGEICAGNNDCAPGSQCVNSTCGVKTCFRFCGRDEDCGSGARCSRALPCGAAPTTHRLCSRPCDPRGAATNGCAVGLKCIILAGEIPDCSCAEDSRNGVDGAACDSDLQCQPGLMCVGGRPGGSCRPLCRLDDPSTCGAGRRCTKLVDPDFKTFGACLPM